MGRGSSRCFFYGINGPVLAFLAVIIHLDSLGIGYAALPCYDSERKAFALGLPVLDVVRV
jgi:hypothetical protein